MQLSVLNDFIRFAPEINGQVSDDLHVDLRVLNFDKTTTS